MLALLRGFPALRAVALAPRTRVHGSTLALALHWESLAGLAGLPSLRSLSLHVDTVRGADGVWVGGVCVEGVA